jgi:hypothetical protein
MFYGQGVSSKIQVGSSGKKHTSVVEVIDGQSFSSRPITHETKPLDVTIGSHTSKVVFIVVSSLRNPIIIGLSWLLQYNP